MRHADDPPYDPYLEGEYDDDEVGTFALGCWMTWAEYYAEVGWTQPSDRHYRLEEEFYKRQDEEFARGEFET